MTQYITFVQPCSNGKGTEYVYVSVPDAIEAQKDSALKQGHTYEDDEQALVDFRIIHWATFSDFNPERFSNSP